MSGERHPLLERVVYRAQQVRAWARRAMPGAMAVRWIVWLTGTAALVIAAGDATLPLVTVVMAGLVASGPAAWPGSGWVSGLAVGTVVLLAISIGQQSVGLPAVGAVAALLYVHHSAAALAAHLRTDTLVPAEVLRHWVKRTAVVLAGSVVVGIGVAMVADVALALPATGQVLLGGAAALAVVAALVGPIIVGRSRNTEVVDDPTLSATPRSTRGSRGGGLG